MSRRMRKPVLWRSSSPNTTEATPRGMTEDLWNTPRGVFTPRGDRISNRPKPNRGIRCPVEDGRSRVIVRQKDSTDDVDGLTVDEADSTTL